MIQWTKEDLEEMCGDEITGQLAFLAGCCNHRLVNDKDIPDGWIISDESLNKFAELIVRECISTIENAENGYQDYRNQIEDGMRNHCIDLIKNKFGVQE